MKKIILGLLILTLSSVIANAQLDCTNVWLYNQSTLSGVQIGDLDVTGNAITVEAVINRTSSYSGGRLYAGDIVSKHFDASTTNYLLRPNSAEITTTSGYYITPPICDISLNKTYHVALVYDGSQLKFYRNGFLMSQVNCTGNLITNNYKTLIGDIASSFAPLPEAFVGYINEVRIWNIARTQVQLRSYMNTTLPNPTTQNGLLAYYTFNSLVNKQGNAAWNGVIIGSASIQNVNPACSSYIVDSCSIVNNPVLTKSKDTSICLGQAAQIDANVPNALDYSWAPSVGLSNAAISNPIVSVNYTTVYYITAHAKNSSGSIVTLFDSVKVSVLPLPVIKTIRDTTICSGTTLQLNTSGASTYSWFPSTGLSNAAISNPLAAPTNSTKYFITGVDTSSCIAKDSVFIDVLSLPTIARSNDTSICLGDSTRLFATGGNSFKWYPVTGLSSASISNPVAFPSTSTQYKVSVIGNNGCSATDSVLVNVISKPNFNLQPLSYSLCFGDSLALTASGGDSYKWFGTDIQNIYSSSVIAKPTVTTIYPVRIYSKTCNIADTLKTILTVNPLPDINITKSNDLDCSHGYAFLNAYGGIKYNWTPTDGLSDPTISNPEVQITQTTKYTVAATSSNGCTSVDTVTVKVINNSTNQYLVPNAFTPNGDGLNDCFGIKGWGVILNFDFSIFNRWGERVFFTTDAANCWNGYYKSIPQSMGTFIYKIKAKTLCGDIERNGTLVLLR